MTTTRQAAVAGMFYPADPVELQQQLDDFLSDASAKGPAPKAIIVPHAGYIYSGPVAASAYARVATLRKNISRVIILGPAHRVPIQGLTSSSADQFTTPLGDIPLDRESISLIEQLPQVSCNDSAHQQEQHDHADHKQKCDAAALMKFSVSHLCSPGESLSVEE